MVLSYVMRLENERILFDSDSLREGERLSWRRRSLRTGRKRCVQLRGGRFRMLRGKVGGKEVCVCG